MKLLKIALFSFICTIVIIFTSLISDVLVLSILGVVSALVCSCSLIAWICTKIYAKFKYSLNIIVIFIFFLLVCATSVLRNPSLSIESYADMAALDVGTAIWLVSLIACVTSILVLIGRVIFTSDRKKSDTVLEKEENDDVDNEKV